MICKLENCESVASARGWCWKHYRRWLRHGDPTTVKKAIHDSVYYSRISLVARSRSKGYFGKLKKDGQEEKLKEISKKAVEAKKSNRKLQNEANGQKINSPVSGGKN